MTSLQVYRAADGSPRLRVRYGIMHARHNVTIGGKEFRGGEFVPSNYAARATPQQRMMMEDRSTNPASDAATRQKTLKSTLKAKQRKSDPGRGASLLDPPRPPSGSMRGVAKVSPETGPGMGLGDAAAIATGAKQKLFVKTCEEIDSRLGLRSRVESAVGSWAPKGQSPGAEPTTVTSYSSARDFDEIRHATACKGYAGNQIAALAFGVDEAGPDTLWSMHVAGELSGIRDALAKHGLAYHTLRQGTGGHGKTEVLILDKGRGLGDKVRDAAHALGDAKVAYRDGHGDFIGDDGGDRKKARKVFRREMRMYAKKYPGRRTWP